MKEIRAYIKKQKLSDVIWALHEIEGLTGATMYEVFGYGRDKEKHSKEKITFVSIECGSRNDIVANSSVLLASFSVFYFRSPWPDLVVGLGITVLFLKSALGIMDDAKRLDAITSEA